MTERFPGVFETITEVIFPDTFTEKSCDIIRKILASEPGMYAAHLNGHQSPLYILSVITGFFMAQSTNKMCFQMVMPDIKAGRVDPFEGEYWKKGFILDWGQHQHGDHGPIFLNPVLMPSLIEYHNSLAAMMIKPQVEQYQLRLRKYDFDLNADKQPPKTDDIIELEGYDDGLSWCFTTADLAGLNKYEPTTWTFYDRDYAAERKLSAPEFAI